MGCGLWQSFRCLFAALLTPEKVPALRHQPGSSGRTRRSRAALQSRSNHRRVMYKTRNISFIPANRLQHSLVRTPCNCHCLLCQLKDCSLPWQVIPLFHPRRAFVSTPSSFRQGRQGEDLQLLGTTLRGDTGYLYPRYPYGSHPNHSVQSSQSTT